jgi:hypothetical protein
MTDLLLVAITMAIMAYAAYFIFMNDGDGNTRPDKTLFAMEEDRAAVPKKRSRFAPPPPPQAPPQGPRRD